MRQLAAFEAEKADLERRNIAWIAASTDDREHAEQMSTKVGASYPMGYGLPLVETAQAIGAYYETRRGILHATGFLLRPDGTVGIALYSSGAIGRLNVPEICRLVDFWTKSDG